MSKQWKPGKKSVELPAAQGAAQGPARPSRIRREPKPAEKEVKPPSPQREAWGVVAGVVLFGAASAALAVGIGEVTSTRSAAAPAPALEFGHCYNHAGPNCVVDGDTAYIAGARVEIAGLDAPEIQGAACPREASRGIEAAVRLNDLLNRGKVTIAGIERQADGRLLRKVEVDGRDVGAAMVSAGVARDYGGGRTSWC